ncbi:uncharacterized protein LOC134185470 isoform X2 [Corticium candelabrum]|uniref:uncharacterized protein LOC134185470 isoform X2 n=1 Tax=Corticium candelabrum TaxID=121492 RepID=UPI002E25F34B|nr:uncharacterized protein LOC134185470 isoform X2 [Corticium candelabrum]
MTFWRLVHALAVVSTLFPAAETTSSRSPTEMRMLEARCFARCFNATATECSYPCSFFNKSKSTCLKKCRNEFDSLHDKLAECNEGCQFVKRVESEAVGASFSPGSPYVPAIPPPPIITQLSGVVTLQWEPPTSIHSKSGVNHGPGRAAVFVIQYASLECGPPHSFDWNTGSHPAEQNFIELPHRSLDLSDDRLYVFRVAAVNVNGTQGFSSTSPLAYSVDKKCVEVSHETPRLVEDLRLLGFRNPWDSKIVDIEVSWKEPAINKACHYVCVTEEASDQEDACRDRTLFDLIVRKAKHYVVSKSVSKSNRQHGTEGCLYRSTVGSIPKLISIDGNQAVKTAVFRNVTKDIYDQSRYELGPPSLSQVKTLSHHINVTVMWLLPADYAPDLDLYRLEYGTGRSSVPIWRQDSQKLGEKDIFVSDAVGRKFSVLFPELKPATEYWFKTTQEYTISELEKEDSDGSKKYYWFRVWSANAKGNGSESAPVYFSFKSPRDQLLIVYITTPLVFLVIVALVIAIVFCYHWRRKLQKIRLIAHPLTSNLCYVHSPQSS